jgi:peptide/nickel transport system ATP-binding protein
MTETLLELKGLEVTFKTRRGTLKAVDDLSLSINKGEILGIVGESGAGKSMTGAAIIGLIDPPGRVSAGEVWFEQERVDARPESLRGRQISMVFQDPLTSLNPLRTVGDQLIETILVHMDVTKAEAIQRARDGLAEVGIDPDRLNAYPHAFSGGMRQRVVIALALATEPKLVIADEPTTALDVSVQAQVLDLLKKLCRERGTSVMLITHDMGVIAQTSDRIAVMYAGRLAEIGNTREVLTNPQHPYTQGLMASTPSVDAKSFGKELFQIPGSMPKLDALPTGCAFNPRCNQVHERCKTERPALMADRAACWLMENAS